MLLHFKRAISTSLAARYPATLPSMASFQRLTEPLVVNQSRIPRFVYGTAWKKDGTMELVTEALRAGFTGVDTACQPRHYREELVGAGITKAINLGVVKREALYVGFTSCTTGFCSLCLTDCCSPFPDPDQIYLGRGAGRT